MALYRVCSTGLSNPKILGLSSLRFFKLICVLSVLLSPIFLCPMLSYAPMSLCLSPILLSPLLSYALICSPLALRMSFLDTFSCSSAVHWTHGIANMSLDIHVIGYTALHTCNCSHCLPAYIRYTAWHTCAYIQYTAKCIHSIGIAYMCLRSIGFAYMCLHSIHGSVFAFTARLYSHQQHMNTHICIFVYMYTYIYIYIYILNIYTYIYTYIYI